MLPSLKRQEMLPTPFCFDIHPLPKLSRIWRGLIRSRIFTFSVTGSAVGSGNVTSTPSHRTRVPVAFVQASLKAAALVAESAAYICAQSVSPAKIAVSRHPIIPTEHYDWDKGRCKRQKA